MAQFFFTRSDSSIAILFDGAMHTLKSDQFNFDALDQHLKLPEHDSDIIKNLINPKELLARLTAGSVSVVGETVFYKGAPLHNALSTKLISMLNAGYDVSPWAKFMDNLMENPSERSRECLYEFLEKFQAPITPDGHFIAFKRVRKDYTDIHSGTFSNAIGKTVTMDRSLVNDNPNQTCSAGLHVCASSYLGHFYASSDNARVIAVKVNPRDVVAVPNDYDSAKMRTCEYVVLQDVIESDSSIKDLESKTVHTEDGTAPTELSESIQEAAKDRPYNGQVVIDFEGDKGVIGGKDGDRVIVKYANDAELHLYYFDNIFQARENGKDYPDIVLPETYLPVVPVPEGIIVDSEDNIIDTVSARASADGEVVFVYNSDGYADLYSEKAQEGVEYHLDVDGVEAEEPTFTRGGFSVTLSALKGMYAVKTERQIAFDTGVPRTTLQRWKNKAKTLGLWD